MVPISKSPQDAQKGDLLTHPIPTGISPTSPESAETASSPWDAAFIGQGCSEEDLHSNLLMRDCVVVRNRVSSAGGNETSLNRFENGRDRCAENLNIELVPRLLGKWRESFVHVIIARLPP